MAGKPGLRNLQVDKLVTSFALKHDNHSFIADEVMRPRLHNKTQGIYYKYDRSHQSLQDTDVVMLAGSDWKSEAKEVEFDVTSGNFTMELYGLKEVIGQDQIRDAGDPIEPIADAAMNVRERILLVKEKLFVDLVSSTANYATGNKVDLVNSLQWNTYGTATGANGPIRQVHSGTLVLDKKVGGGRNVMVVSADSHSVLLRHPDVTESIKYVQMTTKGNSEAALAGLFGVDDYKIEKVIRNAVKEGGTESMTFLGSDFACILRQPERQTLKGVAFGIQFQSAAMPVGMRRTLDSRMNAVEVEVRDEFVFELVDSSAGYLIKDTLA